MDGNQGDAASSKHSVKDCTRWEQDTKGVMRAVGKREAERGRAMNKCFSGSREHGSNTSGRWHVDEGMGQADMNGRSR